MSYENALKTVDFLLEVLAEAEKPAPTSDDQKEAPKKQATPMEEVKEELFTSVEDKGVEEGRTLRVTVNLAVLDKEWKESELGENDTKNVYLGTVGKLMEIEEDDDTVKLRWQNYDECWIPIKACTDAKGAEPTLPSGMLSHLGNYESIQIETIIFFTRHNESVMVQGPVIK